MSGFISRVISLTKPFYNRRVLNIPLPSLQIVRSFSCSLKLPSGNEMSFTSTSVMMQNGASIMEMPCVVQIIDGEFEISNNGINKLEGNIKNNLKTIDFEEESEMVLGFARCNSLKEIISLLNVCPSSEVTPPVALAIVRKIFELENNAKYGNHDGNLYQDQYSYTARSALIQRLVQIICESAEPQIIVETMRSLANDTHKDIAWYPLSFCSKTLILAAGGKLSINQVCEVIKALYNLGDVGKEYIEKVWIGINEKNEMSEDELCNLISVLPLLKSSRMYYYNIIEKNMPLVWNKLKPEQVIRIIHILVQLKKSSRTLLGLISRWTDLNIHILTEGNLRWIVYSLMSLEYNDHFIEQAISRYMKAKKTNIKDSSLVTVILDYCKKLNVRHPTILNFASEYYVEHGKKLAISQIPYFVNSFGHLNYIPPNYSSFFKTLELQVQHCFSQFSPDVLLDILLSCIYLQHYPINLVKNVFSSNFLDKMYSLEENDYNISQEKLKLLDIALTLEAPAYKGPILLRHGLPHGLWVDARVRRCITNIQCILTEIVGNSDRITYLDLVQLFSPSSWYMVECVVDMTGKLDSTQPNKENSNKYAILIHLPEHYDTTENHLIGLQAMKVRHLKSTGLKVVNLKYRILNKESMCPSKLKEYIQEEICKEISTQIPNF